MTAYRRLVVVCDECGTEVNYPPRSQDAWSALRSLKAAGWVRRMDEKDRRQRDYCEACAIPLHQRGRTDRDEALREARDAVLHQPTKADDIGQMIHRGDTVAAIDALRGGS